MEVNLNYKRSEDLKLCNCDAVVFTNEDDIWVIIRDTLTESLGGEIVQNYTSFNNKGSKPQILKYLQSSTIKDIAGDWKIDRVIGLGEFRDSVDIFLNIK